MNASDEKLASCSFCGKTQRQVKKLIAGPSVYICGECVDLCNDIIEEELSPEAKQPVRLPYGEAARLYELLQNAFENDNALKMTAMDVALVDRLQRAVGAPPSD